MRKRPYSIWGAFLRDDNSMFSFHLLFYLSVESPIKRSPYSNFVCAKFE
jgi:hypothetical protein